MRRLNHEILIPVCPEQLGGLPTPRVRHELRGGTGKDVLNGAAKVLNEKGIDRTENFRRGAEETLALARLYGAETFIGVSRSPSCSCSEIYDGSFTGNLKKGCGVTAALLRRSGITVREEEKD